MRHIEEEAVTIDAIAKLRRMVRIPSEQDGLIVIRVDRGPQVIRGLACILVAAGVVQGA